eukprot:1157900-Pelagomonas_calceolata.AAC.12
MDNTVISGLHSHFLFAHTEVYSLGKRMKKSKSKNKAVDQITKTKCVMTTAIRVCISGQGQGQADNAYMVGGHTVKFFQMVDQNTTFEERTENMLGAWKSVVKKRAGEIDRLTKWAEFIAKSLRKLLCDS